MVKPFVPEQDLDPTTLHPLSIIALATRRTTSQETSRHKVRYRLAYRMILVISWLGFLPSPLFRGPDSISTFINFHSFLTYSRTLSFIKGFSASALPGSTMKRISSLFLFSLSLFMGCRTADSTAFVNPLKLLSKSPQETMDEDEIRENSLRFVENAKKQAAGKSGEANQSIQQGQQQIVSWYQDQDDRHIDAAKKHFRNSLQLQPSKNVDAHHGLAVVADLEENFSEAERQYQLALAQSPSDSKLLGNLGYSYLLQNRLADSERYLLRATQIDSSNNDAIKHLGDVYASQGRLGEAQETYSKIMSPEESRQLIANHVPTNSNDAESLVGKFLPDQKQEESSALKTEIDQLRKLRDEQERVLSQNSQRPENLYNRSPGQRQFGPSPEQLLKQNLAAIDQERYQRSNGQPVIIDSNSGEMQRLRPGAQQSGLRQESDPQYYARQNQPATMNGSFTPAPSQMMPRMQHPQKDRLSDNGLPQIQSIASGTYENNISQHSQGQLVQSHIAQRQQSYGPSASQKLNSDPLRQPWTGLQTGNGSQDFNRVSHQESVTRRQPQGLQNLQYESSAAPYGQPAQQQPTFSGGSNDDSRQQIQNQGFVPQNQPRQSNQHQNAFENASMEAARLGMGLGPGTMFSTINQTSPRMQPGANSSWNGNSFSQPNRMLPTNLPLQNLHQAYDQPVVNSLGQRVPGSQVTNNTTQFGTASRFDPQYQQPGNLPPNPQQQYQMQQRAQQLEIEQRLNQQRIQANQQLNASMQDAWNQRRMNLHTPASNAPALLSPAEHGGMVPIQPSPNRENSTGNHHPQIQPQSVETDQYIDQNRPTNSQFQGQNAQRQNGPQQSDTQGTFYGNTAPNQNVIVPAPYHTTSQRPHQRDSNYSGGVIQSNYSERSTPQSSTFSYSRGGVQSQSNSGLPMIVPGTP